MLEILSAEKLMILNLRWFKSDSVSCYLSGFDNCEIPTELDTNDLLRKLDMNNNGKIEPSEIDTSLKGIEILV